MDGIRNFSKAALPGGKPEVKQRKNPDEIVMEYVCSKGDIEHHTVGDSFEGVRQHEMNHIKEYTEWAEKLGIEMVAPHIEVFSEYFPEIKRQVATGGHATCSFMATINGERIMVPVSKEGRIEDPEIVKKLEVEKKRRAGLLKKKKKTDEVSKKDKVEKSKDRKDDDGYLIFDK